MIQLVPVFLVGWIVAGPVLFWLLRPRTAALVIAVGGYLFLPTAMFNPATDTGIVNGVFSLPYWIMPAALPSQFWLTKATAVGLSLLLGMLLREPRALLQVRWRKVDLLMLLWCLWPLVPGLARGLEPYGVGMMLAYQTLVWGIPYLAGRIYFSTGEGMDALADAFMIGGLASAPVCLLEWITGPRVYGWVYGFHPYAKDGVERYIGNRPLVFFELGNQCGVYLAATAMAAVWLAAHGRKRRVARIPLRTAAIVLALLAIMAQGVGAILLSAGVLSLFFLMQHVGKLWPVGWTAALIGLPLLLAAGVALTHPNLESTLVHTRIGATINAWLDASGRHSLAWRLKRDAIHLPAAMRHPLTGNGRWDWWRGEQTTDAQMDNRLPPNDAGEGQAAAGSPPTSSDRARPWDLPMLVLGMYGVPGVLLWISVMLIPVILAWEAVLPKFWRLPPSAASVAMSGIVVVMFLDSLQNSPVFMPILLACGGLAHLRVSTPREVP